MEGKCLSYFFVVVAQTTLLVNLSSLTRNLTQGPSNELAKL